MKKRTLIALLAMGMAVTAVPAMAEDVTEAATESVGTESETEAAIEKISWLDRPEFTASDYVELGTYKELPVSVDPIVISDEELAAKIADDLAAADVYETKEGGVVETGDIANIDYVGKIDGEAFDGGSAEGYDLTIGSGTFIDGFEDGLIGAENGSTVDVTVTFPEDYQATDLAGKEAVFTCTINSIKREAELTDENAAKLADGAYKTAAEYTEYARNYLTDQKKADQEQSITSELMTQLANTCKVNDYPQDVVDFDLKQTINYYKTYAQMYGMEWSDFLSQMVGADEETFTAQATESVKASLDQEMILTAIAEAEDLILSDDDFNTEVETLATDNGYESADDLFTTYASNNSIEADEAKSIIRRSVQMTKVLDFVRENAVITENEVETESEGFLSEAVTEAATE